MKMKWPYLSVILISFTLVTACGTGNQEEFNGTDETMPTKISYTDDDNIEDNINLKRFDLDVDYVDSLSYGVEYESDKNSVQASIDDLDNQKITGEEALNQLSTHFQKFSFNADTPKDEVIREVINVFDLDETFKEFELDVTFADGTKREYEQ